MKPALFNRFALVLGIPALIGGTARAAPYNIDSFTGGTILWTDSAPWNPDITGGPLGADTIVISGNLITADTTINYATGTAASRSITSISVTDTDNVSGSSRSFNFAAGATGSTLTFATTAPSVSTNIANLGSSAAKLTVTNPLFQSGSTFTKGGTGNVRLDFISAGTASGFASNVSSVTSSAGGDLWLSNSSGAAMALPTISLNTNNTRLTLTGNTFTTTNNIATGTNEVYVGGGGTLTLNGSSILSGAGFTLSSNNSGYYYTGGGSTVNYSSSATSSINRIRMGDQWQAAGTAALNVTSGNLNLTDTAANTYAGNPSSDANNTQNVNITVSGGKLAFTSATVADFNFGTSTRNNATVPGALTTVAGNLTISGTGTLDLGTGSRLVLARRNATNTIVNVNSDLNLNGGELRTARDIARGTIGTGAGTTRARVFLNGGTLTTTAAVADLFTAFTGGTDGIFVSSGGAVIDTYGFNSGISSAILQNNTASTGGGLTKNGLGTLTLSTANTFTGDTKVNLGTITLGTALALQNSTLDTQSGDVGSLSFGTLTAATFGGLKGSNNLTLSNTTPAAVTLTVGGNSQSTSYSGNLTGLGGLTKAGTGTLTLTGSNSYSGNTGIGSGIVSITTTGALPGFNTAGRFTVSSGATLAVGNSVTDTEVSTMIATGNYSSGSRLGFDTSSGNRVYGNAVSGSIGLTKLGANTLDLSAVQSYTNATTILAGTLKLSDASVTQLASSSTVLFTGTGTLDLNGSAKTLKNLQFANAGTTATVTNGDLTLTGGSDLSFVPTGLTVTGNTITLNMSGLTSFTYNNAARPMQVGVSALSNNKSDVSLAGGINTITASTLSMANGGDGTYPFNSGTLRLGETNVLSLGTGSNEAIRLSGYRSGGNVITFQTGLTSPTLKLRASDGTGRAGDVVVSEANSGTGSGNPINGDFDMGVADIKVRNVLVASTVQLGTGPTVNGTMSLRGGTFDATSVNLSYVNTSGAPSNINGLNATFTHNAGSSRIGTLTMGDTSSTAGTPTGTLALFNPIYALVSGTLSAETINANPGGKAFRSTSNRKIDWSSGIITNYNDGAGDVRNLSIDGTAGTGGALAINLLTAGTHTFNADAGKTVTLGSYASLNGSGPLNKTGDGALVINGNSSTYTGTLTVNSGTLGGATNLGGSLDITTGATLAPGNSPGTLGVSGNLDLAGLFAYQFTGGTSAADLVNVGGTLDITGASVSWENLGSFNIGDTFTLLGYTAGNLSGTFSSYLDDTQYNFGGGHWLINYNDTIAGANGGIGDRFVTITAVPEPAAALLGGLGLLTLLRRRRHP